jgi:hypothetical protein
MMDECNELGVFMMLLIALITSCFGRGAAFHRAALINRVMSRSINYVFCLSPPKNYSLVLLYFIAFLLTKANHVHVSFPEFQMVPSASKVSVTDLKS